MVQVGEDVCVGGSPGKTGLPGGLDTPQELDFYCRSRAAPLDLLLGVEEPDVTLGDSASPFFILILKAGFPREMRPGLSWQWGGICTTM